MKRIAIVPFLLLLCSVVMAQSSLSIVQTDAGRVSGVANGDGQVMAFKGIPFAAPPVGELRWKAPQPVKSWTGIRPCTDFSKSPMQAKPDEFGVYTREFLIKDEPLSEDCLYLNVWKGAKSPTEKRAVLVWIYGGGFASGGTNVPIYDGEALAKKGIILVSVNYRVGIYGFFAHPELTAESPNHASGNYGLMDQIAALKWVQKNIAAFGGDPAKVTVAGQSAGAFSVNYLVASPLAKGLFSKAIAESGAAFITGPISAIGLASAEKRGTEAASKLGATTLAGLRKLPAEALLKENSFRPIVDGYVVPQPVAATFAANKENVVPVLMGWNADDAFVGQLQSAYEYKVGILKRYPGRSAQFLNLYPGGTDAEAAASQVRISRDMTFGVQNFTWANVQSAKGKAPVYLYRFTRKVPATEAFKKYGAFHTAEVGYVFNNLKFLNRPFEPVDQQIADAISSYWVNFVKTGNPNGSGLPVWPKYDRQNNRIMVLGEQQTPASLKDKAALKFMVKELSGARN